MAGRAGAVRKPGFERFRARRRRKTYGDMSGGALQVFRRVVVLELHDFRERMQLMQRKLGLDDVEVAKRMGIGKATFCLLFRRRAISELHLVEIEKILGVSRDYWTAPIEIPARVPPKARIRALVATLPKGVVNGD